MNELRIIIADDQENVRSALRLLLEQEPGWHVVAELSNAVALLERLKCCPLGQDLLLLDWELPGLLQGKALHQLKAYDSAVEIVALSASLDARQEALSAGARAFISKSAPPEQVILVVHQLLM